MRHFLFDLDLDKVTALFKYLVDRDVDPTRLVYVISPPSSQMEVKLLHQIVGLVDRYNGNYHIPEIECQTCGITEHAIFAKDDDSDRNYVSCSVCESFCYFCILQIPTKDILSVILNRINPEKYPFEDDTLDKPTWLERLFTRLLSGSKKR